MMTDIAQEVGLKAKDNLENEFGSGRVAFVRLDVRSEDEWRRVWDEAEQFFRGKVQVELQMFVSVTVASHFCQVLLNNAGMYHKSNWRQVMEVNLGGAATGTMLAVEKMGVSGGGDGGVVISTASLSSIVAGAFDTIEEEIYTATKWSVLALTRSMAKPHLWEK